MATLCTAEENVARRGRCVRGRGREREKEKVTVMKKRRDGKEETRRRWKRKRRCLGKEGEKCRKEKRADGG